METAIVLVALIGYAGFRQWLQHSRRQMIHRERLAAIERGVELPPLEQEIQRSSFNVERILLLAGLVWISLGVGAFIVLRALITNADLHIPYGIQWIGVAPIAIGLSHLIVYLVSRNKTR